ncbi:MAG: APC family permease [Clostridiaceae bacterium]|nr:APC family permease [Clostridiaceae bacterium]
MNRWEKLILTSISAILVFGILSDLLIVNIVPNFLISQVENFSEFTVVIYQIQATITTLSIALIALMSGVSNDTVYGVSIAHYIMQMKPIILKHKNIITFLLSLILLNYFFISFGLYNSLVSIFIVTIVLIIFMSNEIFRVFQGREQVKKEISNHIKNNHSDTKLLEILFGDILTSIDRDEVLKFKENMNLLIVIFRNSIGLFNKDKILILKWQNNLIEIFAKAFSKTRGRTLKLAYLYFDEIYTVLSKETSVAEELDLWDGTSNEFFDGVKLFDVEELNDLSVFLSIRWKVYQCQRYKVIDDKVHRNNYLIESMFSIIYLAILIDNNKISKFSKADILRQKKLYYDYIRDDISYKKNFEIIPVLMSELRKYTKILIDSQEKEVLKKTFITELNTYSGSVVNDEVRAYHLSIIIYLYYLSYKEELVDEDLKIFSRSILEELEKSVSDYLLFTSFEGPLSNEVINMVRTNLDWWEVIPEDSVKAMLLDDVIDTFLLFYTIHTEKDVDLLKEPIQAILRADVLRFANKFTGTKKISTVDSYREFIKIIFNDDLEEDIAENDLNRLEEVLFDIYKLKEIEEGESKALDEESIILLKNSIKEKVTGSIAPIFQVLNRKKEVGDIQDGSFELHFNTDARYIKSMITQLGESAHSHFVSHILKFLIQKNQIVYKDVVFRDKKALTYLFDLIESHGINVNTLIGYKDRYYGYEKELEFKELASKSNKIKSPKLSNIVTGIDNNDILINSIECEVKIEDVDVNDKIDELEKDKDDKLLYNIANDIYIPFEKDELKKFIRNTKKNIILKIKYEYHFSKNISGVAIIFHSKKNFESKVDEKP